MATRWVSLQRLGKRPASFAQPILRVTTRLRGLYSETRDRGAAIDHNGLPGDEARSVGAEKHRGAGDLVRPTPALERRAAANFDPSVGLSTMARLVSVAKKPGEIALTVMPYGPSS
jgi:hypothetical protein